VAKISVRRRVRPLRFAFLVGHGDAAAFRSAVQLNTALWAGMYNAIVPVFAETPADWQTDATPEEIVRGYLDAFEPDFVVAAEGIDAARFGVAAHATVSLSAMLAASSFDAHGLSVMEVYRWLYREDLRFEQTNRRVLQIPKATDPRMTLLAAAVFGEFPPPPLDFLEKAFLDIGGTEAALEQVSYESLLRADTPLTLGASETTTHGLPGPRRVILLVDPEVPGDLVDFWNLRAIGWHVAAIPVAWSIALARRIAASFAEHARWATSRHAPALQPRLIKARSVAEADFVAFVEAMQGSAVGVVFGRSFLPRTWAASVRAADRAVRVDVWAREGDVSVETEVEGDMLSFRTAGPPFAGGGGGQPRFANVVTLGSLDMPELAGVLPPDLPDIDRLLRSFGRPHMLRVGSEGLAVLVEEGQTRVTFRIPTGFRVFREMLTPTGTLELSSAGKVAQRLISVLGGPDHTRLVMEVEVVEALGKAARSASGDVPYDELSGLFMRLHGKLPEASEDRKKAKEYRRAVVERRLAAMVRARVLKLGLRLQCESCSHHEWLPLDGLREAMTCSTCLSDLPFPTAKPPKNPCWSYRPLGPFAAADYAQGGYAVAAAVRTLRGLDSLSEATWITSFTLKGAGVNLEADFGMFLRPYGPERERPLLILGECKTFKNFEERDVERMGALADMFPRSVLVFATLKDELTPSEVALLEPFARACRVGWKNQVIVLTARELATHQGPPHCWQRSAVAPEAEMFEKMRMAPSPRVSFRRLADATQQLRLGMEADGGWPHPEAR
jgi:hypothetical protein